MADVETQNESSKIEDRLREAWREERRFCHLRGASRFIVWLIAMIALDFLIDWGILARSGASLGYLLPIFNAIVLGWILWHEWLRHLRKYDPVIVALEVESKHPELASTLVSYTQIDDTLARQPNVSRELVEALRSQAIHRARPLDFREIVNFGQLRNLLVVAIATMAIFGAIGLNWQQHVSTLFRRLAGAELEYPKQTEITRVSDKLVIRFGDSVTVSADAKADAQHVVPDAGRLLIRPAGTDVEWKILPMAREGETPTFSRELKELTGDLAYRVQLGDDESDEYRIRVLPSPRVVSARLTRVYPEYIGRVADESDQLNFEVPEGTEVRWSLVCEPAIKRLEVRTDTETLDATLDESGTNASFALVAGEPFKYTFHWTRDDGGRDFEYDDVQHRVRVVADAPPEVELLRPAANGLATARKTVKLRARARDDHGLSRAFLVFSVDEGQETRAPIHDFEGIDSKEFSHDWRLAESIDVLTPGMRIVFAIEVEDRHPSTGEHVLRSASRQLTVVSPEHYLQWYRGELAAQNDEIRRALEAEKTSSTRVKELRAQEEADGR